MTSGYTETVTEPCDYAKGAGPCSQSWRNCGFHGEPKCVTDVADEHFPWHYTEFGVECACGAPMRNEVCLAEAEGWGER